MKRTGRISTIIAFLIAFSVCAHSSENADATPQTRLSDSEAQIWYLYHCGYAVKTSNHLLIFDYWNPTSDSGDMLAQGVIDPSEIKDMSVRVFVSHSHIDHWDTTVLGWQKEIPDIEYFFGWQAFDDIAYHYLPYPRGSYRDNGLEIYTVNSHHSGVPEVGFLVKVDGLVIFHGGDYQGRMSKNPDSNVSEDMNYLRDVAIPGDGGIDLLFLGAWAGDGNLEIIERLNPGALFPMHDGGEEENYLTFAHDCQERNIPNTVFCPQARGNSFVYQDGKIQD
jgi:Beta-lactamase superfamily domain